ncbi:MAG TPA: hypothetical protein VHO25_23475 [Polyangiaceae bacterium]|nr:hypothetical protein [Polyangiaceae bacterium]
MRLSPWLGFLFVGATFGCGGSDPGSTSNAGSGGSGVSAAGTSSNAGGSAGTANGGNGGTDAGGSGNGNGDAGSTGAPGPIDEGDAGMMAGGEGPYLPWAEGNTWTYLVTDAATAMSSEKVTTVNALEAVGGTGPHSAQMANHVITTKMDGTDKTESWQAVVGEQVLRYREQAFSASTGMLSSETHWDPPKLRLDESAAHTVADATWTEQYDETVLPVGMAPMTTAEQDQWTVLATDQMVTVPAGTFSTLVLSKFGGTQTKTYYYARGVGKVKEEGTITEELVSYDVAP